jgi:hypothetical protein
MVFLSEVEGAGVLLVPQPAIKLEKANTMITSRVNFFIE